MGQHKNNTIIFTEDTYGTDFIKKLLHRQRINVDAKRLAGICYPKIVRQLKAAALDYQKVIILADGDWNPQQTKQKLQEHIAHINPKLRQKIHLVIVQSEIEEWITTALDILLKPGQKPSKLLTQHLRRKTRNPKTEYQKHMLPKLAEQINTQKLSKNPSYQKLIKTLKDP